MQDKNVCVQPNLQPKLSNHLVSLRPLQVDDFPELYRVAADPFIWEQHPNPDRYLEPVFRNYFKGALESKGALLIRSNITNRAIGCSRFYDWEPLVAQIKIGYTFFSRDCWGRQFNPNVKKLMLDYAFGFANEVIFHVGKNNQRSRIAMTRLGAQIIGEESVTYYGEQPKINVVFSIVRKDWEQIKSRGNQ